MGEAARRKQQIQQLKFDELSWTQSLSPQEKIINDVAMAAYTGIVIKKGMTEGCFNLAFFLYEYLKRNHQIIVQLIIGYVNDGGWEGGIPHAWIEYNNKITDISLHVTSQPNQQATGDVIVLDKIKKYGRAKYRYWKNLPESAIAIMDSVTKYESAAAFILECKQKEHIRLKNLVIQEGGIHTYFNEAPDNCSYEYLCLAIRPFLKYTKKIKT